MWWIQEDLGDGPVSATDAAGRSQQLQVIGRLNAPEFGPYTVLAVPVSLSVGERLTLGARELSVSARPLGQPLDLTSIVRRSYRVDLGGTGLGVTLPEAQRERLFIPAGYAAVHSVNPGLGIQVLKGLRVSQAGSLCPGASSTGPDSAFVPMWIGDLGVALRVHLYDADHFENSTGLTFTRPTTPIP